MWSRYVDPSPFDLNQWKIKEKVSKDLQNNPFDGTQSKYRDWAANVVNHLLGSSQGYGKNLWLVQQDREPITYYRLSITNRLDLQVNWWWLTRALWTFLYEHVTPAMKRTLVRKACQAGEHIGLDPC